MKRFLLCFVYVLFFGGYEKILGQTSQATEDGTYEYSGTIPVLFVETENHTPVLEKGEYLKATYYLKTFGWKGYEDVASPEKMDSCYIRCRGNWSFLGYDKKPYKLKLEKKESLLGMSKNKHFVLLNQAGGSPKYMDTPVGNEVSRMLNLQWTPEERPVEVVVNGEYMGLYCLTEHVRVGKNRVDIVEQDDNETDINKISSGGWLVELDFYEDTPQIRIDVSDTDLIEYGEKGIQKFWLTVHSPEELSDLQYEYLTAQFQHIKDAVFNEDKSSTEWEDLIDMEDLIKYTMQAQITTRMEAFLGSTFIYKKDGNSKWCFGPVWDLEWTLYYCKSNIFTWDENNYSGISILHEIAKFPRFQDELRNKWQDIRGQRDHLHVFIDSICEDMREAVKHDAHRWPKYGNPQIDECGEKAKELIDYRWAWLDEQLRNTSSTAVQQINKTDEAKSLYNLSGVLVCDFTNINDLYRRNIPKGVYIVKSQSRSKKIILH